MGKETIAGFRAFPVKLNVESTAQHWLFCKEHSVRVKSDDKPEDRTLFIVNVPSYYTEDTFKNIFKQCGVVTSVYFHKAPTADVPDKETSQFFPEHSQIKGYKVAYVVFEKCKGLQKALKFNKTMEPLVLSTLESSPSCGLQKWCQEYNNRIPDVNLLQSEIDIFMENFDTEISEKAQKEKELMEKDDEGWVTVTKRGRNRGFARKESVEKNILQKEKKKRSRKELQNFYRFQIRESKMNRLINLRKKFEEDKKKLLALKQSRKFKPF